MTDKDKLQTQLLLDLIRNSREQELLFLQTVRDAAILAGEQVQDKRLDFLEAPPDTSASDVLIDFLISLALGPVASAVVKSFTERGMRAILRNRGVVFVPTVGISLKTFIDEAEKVSGGLLAITDSGIRNAENLIDGAGTLVQNLTNVQKKEFELWRKFAEDTLNVGVDVAKGRLIDKATAPDKPTVPDSKVPGGDTASVAVRRAALAFVRLQEPAVRRVYEHYEEQVRSGDFQFTPKTFITFLENNLKFSSSIKDETNSELETALSLFFEACIWLLHFGSATGIFEQVSEDVPGLASYGPYSVPTGIRNVKFRPERHIVNYWLSRFPHPDGNGRESFFFYSIRHGQLGSGGTELADQAIADLLKWFGDIDARLTPLQKRLNASGLDILGPVNLKKSK